MLSNSNQTRPHFWAVRWPAVLNLQVLSHGTHSAVMVKSRHLKKMSLAVETCQLCGLLNSSCTSVCGCVNLATKNCHRRWVQLWQIRVDLNLVQGKRYSMVDVGLFLDVGLAISLPQLVCYGQAGIAQSRLHSCRESEQSSFLAMLHIPYQHACSDVHQQL